MKLVPKGLFGLGVITLAAAPLALSAASVGSPAGAQAVEPIFVSFDEVGAYDYVVPEDARCISFEAIGAAGGTGNQATPGLGGRVTGTLQALPGQTLQVNVGGAGATPAGVPAVPVASTAVVTAVRRRCRTAAVVAAAPPTSARAVPR